MTPQKSNAYWDNLIIVAEQKPSSKPIFEANNRKKPLSHDEIEVLFVNLNLDLKGFRNLTTSFFYREYLFYFIVTESHVSEGTSVIYVLPVLISISLP